MKIRIAYLLTSRVLELGSAQGFNDSSPVFVTRADAHDGLSNVYSCNCTLGFTKGTTHSSLEPEYITLINSQSFRKRVKQLPISSGTAQHFVDANHMEGMNSHPDVESVFAAVLHQVLVNQNMSVLLQIQILV